MGEDSEIGLDCKKINYENDDRVRDLPFQKTDSESVLWFYPEKRS